MTRGFLAPNAGIEAMRKAFLEAIEGNDIDRIRLTSRSLLNNADSQARIARFIKGSISKINSLELKPFRIALLSSFSIELIHDLLFAYGCTEGLRLVIYQCGYNQYQQEILDPESRLYSFAPDLIVIAVEGDQWAPTIYNNFLDSQQAVEEEIARPVSKISELLRALRKISRAPVLFHSLSYPRFPALGILDIGRQHGQRRVLNEINVRAAALAQTLEGVYLLDIDALIQRTGYELWHDPRLQLFARCPISSSGLETLTRIYLRYIRALTGLSRKCVIVDLDNTLWGGILGEDGPRGISLGSEYPGNAYVAFQKSLLELRGRGVLLAIASKNNLADVERAFAENPAMVLSLNQFSAKEIHWEPKSVSVQRIAASLNLDLRHIVFVDDNAAECAEVQSTEPRLTTITLPKQPEKYVDALMADGLFDTLTFSKEDTDRAQLYVQREAAEQLRVGAQSLEQYYLALEMRAYLEPVNPANLSRAAQLTQKTTQFNATTKRYTEADIKTYIQDRGWLSLTMRLVDSFGDNGIVGLLLAHCSGTICHIDTFLMSCRVINRTAETVMLHWLTCRAKEEGASTVHGVILPTPRNVPIRDLYERHGFVLMENKDGPWTWRLDLSAGTIELPAYIQVVDSTQDISWKNA